MLQTLKVWAFRKYYRFISAGGWRGYHSAIHWGALEMPSPAGPVHGRIYNSTAGADKPVIVYFHGGGWVIGDLDTHHPFCQALSQRCDCTVIAVDYRLAPEYPFPAAPDDCLAAVAWISDHLDDFGPSNGQLVIAGDSAGGNLAVCTCLGLDDATREKIAGAMVIYPVVDHYSAGFPSYVERATGQKLTSNIMHWFWDTYLAGIDPRGPEAARAFPLQAGNLASLPATLLVTAEYDPLRDEGKAFSDRLRETGVNVHYRHFPDAAHGFACSEGPCKDHRALLDDVADWLAGLG
jgi:acetyl esterase